MRKLTIIIAMFAIAMFAKSEEINVAPEGFTALFNGKDLTGWDDSKDNLNNFWKIENGILEMVPVSPEKNENASLYTLKKDYKNFVLLIDVCFPAKGDSGIFTRLGQINLRVNNQGPIGFEIHRKKHPELFKKGNIEIAKAKFGKTEFNKWYKIKIIMKGNFVTIDVNGKSHVKDVELVPHKGETERAIGIQQYYRSKIVKFKNIFIKEID